MSVHYKDLESLIFSNGDARQFFNELPKDIRANLKPHYNDIHSYESLREYAEKFNNKG